MLRIALILCLLAFPAHAAQVQYVRAIDGDTAVFLYNGKNQSIRFDKFDTPELRAKCKQEKAMALAAKNALNDILKSAKVIELRNIHRDKYPKRLDADVFVDRQSVADLMIAKGHARPYSGGKRQTWCSWR